MGCIIRTLVCYIFYTTYCIRSFYIYTYIYVCIYIYIYYELDIIVEPPLTRGEALLASRFRPHRFQGLQKEESLMSSHVASGRASRL